MTAEQAHHILGDPPTDVTERQLQIACLRLYGHPGWWRVNHHHEQHAYQAWRKTRGGQEILAAYGRGELTYAQLLSLAAGAPYPWVEQDAQRVRHANGLTMYCP